MMECQLNENEFLVTNLSQGDLVLVNSETFNCECWGYVQRLTATGAEVRVELEDDHPSMQDAVADTGFDPDNIELYDLVQFKQLAYIRRLQGPDERIRVWIRTVTDEERAARARRRGFTRLEIPELDHGLRR